jgi:hypothetical protein
MILREELETIGQKLAMGTTASARPRMSTPTTNGQAHLELSLARPRTFSF